MEAEKHRKSTETYIRNYAWGYRKRVRETLVDSVRPEEGMILSRYVYAFMEGTQIKIPGNLQIFQDDFVFMEGVHITNKENMQRFRNKFLTVAKHLEEEEKVRAAIAFVSQEMPMYGLSGFHTIDMIIASKMGVCFDRAVLTASILNSGPAKPKKAFSVVSGFFSEGKLKNLDGAHVWVEGPIAGLNHIIDPTLHKIHLPNELPSRHAVVQDRDYSAKIHYWRTKMPLRTLRRE